MSHEDLTPEQSQAEAIWSVAEHLGRIATFLELVIGEDPAEIHDGRHGKTCAECPKR